MVLRKKRKRNLRHGVKRLAQITVHGGMNKMKVAHKIANNTLYVSICGELDESCAAQLRVRLDELFEKSGIARVVLDLAGISFMDSTGIGMLIGRYKVLKARNIPLLLSSPQSVVDKLLSLSGIYEIMPKIG